MLETFLSGFQPALPVPTGSLPSGHCFHPRAGQNDHFTRAGILSQLLTNGMGHSVCVGGVLGVSSSPKLRLPSPPLSSFRGRGRQGRRESGSLGGSEPFSCPGFAPWPSCFLASRTLSWEGRLRAPWSWVLTGAPIPESPGEPLSLLQHWAPLGVGEAAEVGSDSEAQDRYRREAGQRASYPGTALYH